MGCPRGLGWILPEVPSPEQSLRSGASRIWQGETLAIPKAAAVSIGYPTQERWHLWAGWERDPAQECLML